MTTMCQPEQVPFLRNWQSRGGLWNSGVSLLVGGLVSLGCTGGVTPLWAQEKITDQVAVTVLSHSVVGVTSGSGLIPIRLGSGERVLAKQSKGVVGFIHTSTRLLGFTGVLQRWREERLDISESVQGYHLTPRMILVQTDRHVFGYQGLQGQWKMRDLSLQEVILQIVFGENIAVVITNKNVLGFSAFTGGFFAEDLSNDELVQELSINDNIAVLKMPSRQLIFRSQLAVWAEVR